MIGLVEIFPLQCGVASCKGSHCDPFLFPNKTNTLTLATAELSFHAVNIPLVCTCDEVPC